MLAETNKKHEENANTLIIFTICNVLLPMRELVLKYSIQY